MLVSLVSKVVGSVNTSPPEVLGETFKRIVFDDRDSLFLEVVVVDMVPVHGDVDVESCSGEHQKDEH